MFSKALNDLRRGVSLYHVWVYQSYHDVSSKYKRTVLGSVWISGAMVATSLALSIVMGGIQGQNLPDILPYVMSGIMAFGLSGYIMSEAPEVYMAASGIIRNHAYPFMYYAFESVTRIYIIFLHNIIVFYLFSAALGKISVPHWTVLLGLLIVYINSVLWGTLVSMVSVRFRDLRFLLPFLAQIFFFLTPIFWRPEKFTGWKIMIVKFNPFYGLTELIRAPLLGSAATVDAWELSLSSLGLGAILWLIFFNAYRGKIAFWV